MRPLSLLLGLFLVCIVSQADSQEIYRWTDETGKMHLVDEFDRIPASHRDQVEAYRISSGRRKGPSTERQAAPERAPEIPETQERVEKPVLTPEERLAKIEALRTRERELEQERHRQMILERRFNRGARGTAYRKKIDQLNRDIEAIQEEMDAIRIGDQ